VVYNGLLKKERRDIHERIGITIQQLFPERLPEFYETLAFHFARGKSGEKAVDYLIKAGEKSLARYSVEEAHQYFKQAFKVLSSKTDRTQPENLRLIDLLNIWAYAFYYNGDIKGMIELFSPYENLARSLKDESRTGMYYAWLGIAYYMGGEPHIAYEYLTKAISFGEKSKDQKVIGYACSWLAWTCPELGRSDEGIAFGERAIQIAKLFPSDPYLFFKPLGGICVCNFWTGNIKKILQDSVKLVEYGQKYVNNRSITMGYFAHSFGNLVAGNVDSVIDSGNKAIEVSRDPFYFYFPRMFVGAAYVLNGKFHRTLELFDSSMGYFKQYGLGQ